MNDNFSLADFALEEANAAIEWAIANPQLADWMKVPLTDALRNDPVAVANQVDLLKHLVDRLVRASLGKVYGKADPLT